METAVRLVEAFGLGLIRLGFAVVAVAQRGRRRWRRWLARQRLFVGAALRRIGLGKPPPARRYGRRRTPPEVEEAVCRLHVDVPHLGARALAQLLVRVSGVSVSRNTVRAIWARRRDLLVELEAAKKAPRRISVDGRLKRWAVDFTLVWLLGIVPVWLFGVVDFHGSRLLALEACFPTARSAASVLERLFAAHGAPEILQSDNGGQFVADEFGAFLRRHRVRHVRIRPAHPWTNGRIERLFRTFKEVLRWYAPVLLSRPSCCRVATSRPRVATSFSSTTRVGRTRLSAGARLMKCSSARRWKGPSAAHFSSMASCGRTGFGSRASASLSEKSMLRISASRASTTALFAVALTSTFYQSRERSDRPERPVEFHLTTTPAARPRRSLPFDILAVGSAIRSPGMPRSKSSEHYTHYTLSNSYFVQTPAFRWTTQPG